MLKNPTDVRGKKCGLRIVKSVAESGPGSLNSAFRNPHSPFLPGVPTKVVIYNS